MRSSIFLVLVLVGGIAVAGVAKRATQFDSTPMSSIAKLIDGFRGLASSPNPEEAEDAPDSLMTASMFAEKLCVALDRLAGEGASKELKTFLKDETGGFSMLVAGELRVVAIDYFDSTPTSTTEPSLARLELTIGYERGFVQVPDGWDQEVEKLARAALSSYRGLPTKSFFRATGFHPHYPPYEHPLSPEARPLTSGDLFATTGMKLTVMVSGETLEPRP